jgi:hypothetical protein
MLAVLWQIEHAVDYVLFFKKLCNKVHNYSICGPRFDDRTLNISECSEMSHPVSVRTETFPTPTSQVNPCT